MSECSNQASMIYYVYSTKWQVRGRALPRRVLCVCYASRLWALGRADGAWQARRRNRQRATDTVLLRTRARASKPAPPLHAGRINNRARSRPRRSDYRYQMRSRWGQIKPVRWCRPIQRRAMALCNSTTYDGIQ